MQPNPVQRTRAARRAPATGAHTRYAGALGRAETMYTRALGVLPTHPQAGCNLAIVLVHLRRVAEARHRLGEVMRHNPEYTDCIANFESTLKSAHV